MLETFLCVFSHFYVEYLPAFGQTRALAFSADTVFVCEYSEGNVGKKNNLAIKLTVYRNKNF